MAAKKKKEKPKLIGEGWGLTAVFAALFGVGQFFLFRGHILAGVVFSLLSIVSWLGATFGRETLAKLGQGEPSSRKGATTKPGSRKPGISKKALKSILSLNGLRFLMMLGALALAFKGQSLWSQVSDASTLSRGAWVYVAACALFIAAFWPWLREGLSRAPLDRNTEWILLGAVMVFAAFMRVYEIGSIPSGLFIDQGYQGYGALRILHEGWRPFYVEDTLHAYALGLYMLAAWFKVFGATEITLKLFYVFISLAAFPLIYWTFRQLSGPRVALLSVFILAAMRSHINFSRNAFPTVQLLLYIFGTLAFLFYALKSGK